MVKSENIVLYPYITEKISFLIERENKLEFIVRRTATKPEIKKALETMLEIKIEKINTRITKKGKRAIVKLAKGYSAEELAVRLGQM